LDAIRGKEMSLDEKIDKIEQDLDLILAFDERHLGEGELRVPFRRTFPASFDNDILEVLVSRKIAEVIDPSIEGEYRVDGEEDVREEVIEGLKAWRDFCKDLRDEEEAAGQDLEEEVTANVADIKGPAPAAGVSGPV
jgi:hypothetical protein